MLARAASGRAGTGGAGACVKVKVPDTVLEVPTGLSEKNSPTLAGDGPASVKSYWTDVSAWGARTNVCDELGTVAPFARAVTVRTTDAVSVLEPLASRW
jgi:hypothetical protein